MKNLWMFVHLIIAILIDVPIWYSLNQLFKSYPFISDNFTNGLVPI